MGFGSFVKKLTKPFKKVAKGIKKVASKAWKGIKKAVLKPIGKLFAKTFGKLGPLGTIAISFLIPGLGTMLSTAWSSAAGALAGSSSGILQAVGAGMNAISAGLGKAASFISSKVSNSVVGKAFSSVTDKVGSVFKSIGGSVSNGAKNLFSAASEWTKTNLPGVHKGLSNMGEWVAQKAQDIGLTESASLQESNAVLQANPEFAKFADPQKIAGRLSQTTGQEAAAGALTQGTLDANPEFAKFADPRGTAEELAKSTAGRSAGTTFGAIDAGNAGASFAKTALEAGSSLLGGLASAGEADSGFAVPFQTVPIDTVGTDRFGAGGTGATGGQFLTPQQLQFFQQQATLLGQVG